MKRARDRCKSAEKKLSINDLYAEVKSRNASVVNSSPFKASISFLLTPIAISLERGLYQTNESLRMRVRRFALNRRNWLPVANVLNCE